MDNGLKGRYIGRYRQCQYVRVIVLLGFIFLFVRTDRQGIFVSIMHFLRTLIQVIRSVCFGDLDRT